MRRLARALVLFTLTGWFFSACDGDDDGGGGGGPVAANSLAGTIRDPSGMGIQGVVVRVDGATSAEATTDVDGNFIVLDPPTGQVGLHLDAQNAVGGTFPDLELMILVAAGANNLSQPLVLPDLAAGGTMTVPVDAGGMTSGDIMIMAPDGSTLDIADMTTILVDGAVPPGSVDINITPVDPINVPMPLPGMLDAGAFVTIQPPGASFNPALGITLPNPRNFPVGTMVDIWSFDHDLATWVNRSDETGNQGVVTDLGGGMLFIVADAVITEGGWHSGALPVDPTCATILEGQVFELGAPDPLANALIALSTGQFASTDADGMFSIPSVPAYDASMLPKVCLAADITLEALAPVSFGAMSVTMTIPAGTIVTGGTTTIPAFDIPVTDTGSLVGSVSDDSGPVTGTVSITGTETLDVDTDENGSFFVASLDPGPYTASFPFASGLVSEDFTVDAHETTAIALTAGPTPPGGALIVRVLDFSGDFANPQPVDDACLTLQGVSGGPLFGTTDATGEFTFASTPTGPYTVTAQKDTPSVLGTDRFATTLVGVNPTVDPRTVVVPFLATPVPTPPTLDATFDGTILNPPAGADIHYQITTDAGGGFMASGVAAGSFTVPVPSGLPLDVAATAIDQIDGTILSAVITKNVMLSTGQTLMTDFDFASACAFDQTVPVTYSNVQTLDGFFAEFDLEANGDLFFSYTDGTLLPPNINLPDLAAAKFAGVTKVFESGSEAFLTGFKDSFCDVPFGSTVPASVQVDYLGVPVIVTPPDMSNFPTFGAGSSVQFTPGSGNGVSTGFNSVTFGGEAGDVFTFYDILVPATTNLVILPPVSPGKPMFATGFFAVNAATLRFDLPGFNFATAFDQNFPTNLLAIEDLTFCGASETHFFTVGSPVRQPADPRERYRGMSLGHRLVAR